MSEHGRPRRRRRVLAAGIGVLVAVLFTRAAMSQADPVAVPPAPNIPSVDADAVARHLGAMIRHRTVAIERRSVDSPQALAAGRQTLRELYPRTFEVLSVQRVAEHSNVRG